MLLKDFLTAIRAALRTGDVIARWGEGEFALALPDCDLQQAKAIASRLLNVVPSGQTVSIGLTRAQAQDTPRAMLQRADTALYAAKDGSRNQIKAYQGSTPPVLSTKNRPFALVNAATPQIGDKRRAVGPVHSQYTRRPLTALNHRYPQRRCLSNTNGLHDYQRSPTTQTMTF
jgi:Diguanylate cyclase, GGDEF domain